MINKKSIKNKYNNNYYFFKNKLTINTKIRMWFYANKLM